LLRMRRAQLQPVSLHAQRAERASQNARDGQR
jgi:hypothetical protein